MWCVTHVYGTSGDLRVISCQQKVEQQADGLFNVDLVGGWHAFVQLVENGGEYCFQASHAELSVGVHCIQTIFSEGFDNIPDVHQVHFTWQTENTKLLC